MACNPALCAGSDGVAAPVPFTGEQLLLSRDGVEFELDGLERYGVGQRGKTLFAPARLYLSTVRVVLVCKTASTALRAFDAPLAYVRAERFNQPIFGANNLTGTVFQVGGPDGGPAGGLPPHAFAIYFREGGCGTFLPLFFRCLQHAREVSQSPMVAPHGAMLEMRDMRSSAYLDPNDPTVLFVPEDRACGGDADAPDAYPVTHG